MSERTLISEPNLVSVYDAGDGALVFTFVPRDVQQERAPNGVPKRLPQFVVTTRPEGNAITFDWSSTPDEPRCPAEKEEMQKEVESRIKARAVWIRSVTALVDQVFVPVL